MRFNEYRQLSCCPFKAERAAFNLTRNFLLVQDQERLEEERPGERGGRRRREETPPESEGGRRPRQGGHARPSLSLSQSAVDVGLVLAFVVEAHLAFNSFVAFKFE